MRHFFQLFAEKLTQTPRHRGLLEKVAHFGEINDFSCFLAKWGTVCNFLLKSGPKRPNVVVCSRKFFIFVKSTIYHAFSRNEALSATFYWKVDPNAESWWFARKGFKLWQNRRFFLVFRKMRNFFQVFAEKMTETSNHGSLLQNIEHFGQMDDFPFYRAKSGTFCNFFLVRWPKRRDMVVYSKKLHSFCKIHDFSCFFAKWGSFWTFLPKSRPKRRNMVACSKKLQVFAKSTIFPAFPRNEPDFATFCLKVYPNAKTCWFAREGFTFWPNRRFVVVLHEMRHLLQVFTEKLTQKAKRGNLFEKVWHFGQIDEFTWPFAKWGTFCNFLLQSWPKRQNMVVCTRRFYILAKSMSSYGFSRN